MVVEWTGDLSKVHIFVVLLDGVHEDLGVAHVPRFAHNFHLQKSAAVRISHEQMGLKFLYLDAENIRGDPSPLVDDVLDGHAEAGHEFAQFSDASGSVAHGHGEFEQAAVHGQAALQATAQNRCVNVSAAERNHDSGNIWFWFFGIKALETHLLPLNSSRCPARIAAKPAAPAPSTTHFSSSMSRRIAMAIHSSFTTTYLSQ